MYDYYRSVAGELYKMSIDQFIVLAHRMRLTDEKLKYSADTNFKGLDEQDLREILKATKVFDGDGEALLCRERAGSHNINDKDHLYRYEFIEVLLRIAEFRYMENYSPKIKPLATNYVEALSVLSSQVLKPFFEEATSLWSGFRENHLWTVEINSLYSTNMP